MEKSPEIDKLAEALAKAQGAIKGAAKSSTNPHFGKRYADLASVWESCRKPLTDNGLSVVQTVAYVDGRVEVTTLLLHTTGQWISGTMGVPVDKPDAQRVGSSTTYARRFSLAAMVGVAPEDEDDDGEAAIGPSRGRVMDQPGGVRDEVAEQRAARAAWLKKRAEMASACSVPAPAESDRAAPGALGKETTIAGMSKAEATRWLDENPIPTDEVKLKFHKRDLFDAISAELAWRRVAAAEVMP
jgi:ERF superfamily